VLCFFYAMASVSKLGSRPYWYASYRDAEGKQHNKSTKIEISPSAPSPRERSQKASENKRLAMSIAQTLEEAERGNPVESHLRKVINDVSTRVNKRKIEFASCDKYLNDWLKRASATRSERTHEKYEITIKRFLKFLKSRASGQLGDISAKDIQDYTTYLSKTGRSPSTVKQDARILNIPFALAQRQGLILHNPVPSAEIPNSTSESKRPFTKEQIKEILTVATGEWKTVIMFGCFTGARLGDCISMQWKHIDLQKKLIRFRPQKTQSKKKDVIIPLHPTLESHLLALESSDDPDTYLCPQLANHPVSGRSGLSKQFIGIIEKCPSVEQIIQDAPSKRGRKFSIYSFHSFRHTFNSILADSGVSQEMRMALTGHASVKVNEHYTHRGIQSLRKAVEKLPKLA
jgi:integrase